jgi:hypothetical protein
MKTTDHIVGEIVRNIDDAEGVVREWLEDRVADGQPFDRDLQLDIQRVLEAWNIAIEITGDEYTRAATEAGACTDPVHAARFPDPAAYGDDQPAHVAVHLGL